MSNTHAKLGFGGSQVSMRPSLIENEDEYLGACPERTLKVGDTQVMVFLPTDNPPVIASNDPQFDTIDTTKPNQISKKSGKELREELIRLGKRQLAEGKAAEVIKNARNAGLELTKTIRPITQGYVGKPKGLKQIAWERGFWSAADLCAKGKVSEKKIRLKLDSCKDFSTEMTQMQAIAKSLGVQVVITPKAHPEIAGQGIEYSWGYSKLRFRKDNTAAAGEKVKQLEANIYRSLDINSEHGLNLERVRKFVRKAREYKMVYREYFRELDDEAQEEAATSDPENPSPGSKRKAVKMEGEKHHYAIIERQVKAVKAHRCALDIDHKFIIES